MALTEIGARLSLRNAAGFGRDARRAAGDVDGIDRAARRADSGLGRLGGAMASLGKGAALGGLAAATVGVGALAAGLFQGFKDAAALETIMAKTNAVIKSTNGVAGVTARGVVALSDELESVSGIDGDSIINAQNLLLTFTKVRNGVGEVNHVFDLATRAAVDMAAALGQDPSAAAMQLGKALNDPVKGVSALSKAGVSFTAEQKKTIKTLVATNRVMDAQKLILGEMQVQFGGAAKAAGSGFEGSMARAKDALGDMFRDVAMPLLPMVTAQFENFSNYMNNTGTPAIVSFVKGFRDGTGRGGELRTTIGNLTDAVRDNWPQIKEMAGQVGGLALTISRAGSFASKYLLPPLARLRDMQLTPVIDGVKTLAGAVRAVADVGLSSFSAFLGMVGRVAGTLAKIPGPTRDALRAVAEAARSGQSEIDQLKRQMDNLGRTVVRPSVVFDVRAPRAAGQAARAAVSDKLERLDGARADGGPVRAGGAYLVGERGPEIFHPRVSGDVLTPRQAARSVVREAQPQATGGDLHITLVMPDGQVLTRQVVKNLQAQAARR